MKKAPRTKNQEPKPKHQAPGTNGRCAHSRRRYQYSTQRARHEQVCEQCERVVAASESPDFWRKWQRGAAPRAVDARLFFWRPGPLPTGSWRELERALSQAGTDCVRQSKLCAQAKLDRAGEVWLARAKTLAWVVRGMREKLGKS